MEESKKLDKLTICLGLFAGSIIISGLFLNVFGQLNTVFFLVLSLAFFLFGYQYFVKDNGTWTRQSVILTLLCLTIAAIMIAFSKYPFSDFWWYNAKNWIIKEHLFETGKIVSWIRLWHFGNPLLQMYGPGSHVIAAFITQVASVNVFFSGIIVNSLAYLLLILGMNNFLRNHVSKKIALYSSAIVAISPRLFNEVFIQGHYPNILALAFGLLALSFLDSKDKKERLLFTLFMFLTIVTHFSFFVILFTATALTLVLMLRLKGLKVLGKFVAPLLLSSFWLIPAIAESKYWHGTLQNTPNPAIMYLLSLGPFVLLAIYGLYVMLKNRITYLAAFTLSLVIMSFIPLLIFPLLPSALNELLQKVFVDTFKSTATASIFLVVALAYGANEIIQNKKYKQFSVTLLALFVIFALFQNYVYARQDAIDVVKFNGEYYRDTQYTRIYLDNYAEIKEVLTEKQGIYHIDPMIGIELFNVSVSSGPPIPAPKATEKMSKSELLDYYRERAVEINILDTKADPNVYRLVKNLGGFEVKEYSLSLDYIKKIIQEGKIIDYAIYPEKYPSRTDYKELRVYDYNSNAKIVDDGLEDEIEYDLNSDGISIIVRNMEEHSLGIGYNYSPHWKAYVDGKKTEITRNELGFMTIEVPENSEKLELKWRYSFADYLGMLISLLGVTLVFVFALKIKSVN